MELQPIEQQLVDHIKLLANVSFPLWKNCNEINMGDFFKYEIYHEQKHNGRKTTLRTSSKLTDEEIRYFYVCNEIVNSFDINYNDTDYFLNFLLNRILLNGKWKTEFPENDIEQRVKSATFLLKNIYYRLGIKTS